MNLYWQPVETSAEDLSDKLKFALRERYGPTVDAVFCHSDVPYLQGLQDAGIKDAAELIEAIAKHDSIRVFEK